MIAASVAKVWELALILPELKSCIIQFTHTKQRGTIKKNRENQYLSVSKKNFIQSVRQVGIFQRFILQ